MNTNLLIIGVIGSGEKPYLELSSPLGQWIAKNGFHLVNGGGAGTMIAVAKAFTEVPQRKGLSVGIAPSGDFCNTPEKRSIYSNPLNYPNPYIEIPIRTHLPLSENQGLKTSSRNHIVVLTAEIIVALPGTSGTRSEIQLCLDYKKPLIILDPVGCWAEFKNSSARFVQNVQEAAIEIKKFSNIDRANFLSQNPK
jgi:uncharacterized protein (TIGR00725 family)